MPICTKAIGFLNEYSLYVPSLKKTFYKEGSQPSRLHTETKCVHISNKAFKHLDTLSWNEIITECVDAEKCCPYGFQDKKECFINTIFWVTALSLSLYSIYLGHMADVQNN